MRPLTKPNEDAGDLFMKCVADYSQQRTQERKDRLVASESAIRQEATAYDVAAQSAKWHTVVQKDPVGGPGTATKQDMENLYGAKLVLNGSPGRPTYDKIMSLPPRGICPLCGQRIVTTLDHYLPKSKYPALAVTPANLIPCCFDCNHGKLAEFPSSAEDQTLHPYYDDFTKEQWLYADIIKSSPPALLFVARPPAEWDTVRKARVNNHLRIFQLGKLYAANAADELLNIRASLVAAHNRGGAAEVKVFLQDAAGSRTAIHVNSWQTAMYQALSLSDWFCDTGYGLI